MRTYEAFLQIALWFAATATAASPSVDTPLGTFVGSNNLFGVESFHGIPFAQPPVGQLRLRTPQPVTASFGTITATGVPRACPQATTSVSTSPLPSVNSVPAAVATALANITALSQASGDPGEDCLTLNVQRPSSAKEGSKLPVLFWIYGGGYTAGSTQSYDGTNLINFASARGTPIIFVAVNYRLGGFGFLGGKQIVEAGQGNLGLLDQRAGMQWVADNIAHFGGDPDKVTIWGESAGSASVFNQLALFDGNHTYKGKPLFRGAIMDSGSIVPTQPADGPRAQNVFDTLATQAGCSNAANVLDCLRGLDYTSYLNAADYIINNAGPLSPTLPYQSRPDGRTLTQSPDILAATGKLAPVPFIIGDNEDEGTLFVLGANLQNTSQVVSYMKNVYFNKATDAQVSGLVSLYPDDITAGSPFRTGILNNIYPQYKRVAAIVGDASFTLTRRLFLNDVLKVRPETKTWSYLATYFHYLPIVGTTHALDILPAFGYLPGFNAWSVQNYYVSFVTQLDPNANKSWLLPEWPQWGAGKQLLNFDIASNKLIADDFRSAAYNYLTQNVISFRV